MWYGILYDGLPITVNWMQATQAEERIRLWGGQIELHTNQGPV